jgi:hypothetical protein
MKIPSLGAAFLFAVTQFHASGATLDNFSGTTSSDSANYTTLLSYPTPPTSASPETFSINSSHQLQPTGSASPITTTFLWNAGQTLGIGDSVSLDLVNLDAVSNFEGLAFTTSPTSANGSGDNYVYLGLVSISSNNGNNIPATEGDSDINGIITPGLTFNFGAGSITESITRTATALDYKFSGPGLTSNSGSFSGSYLYSLPSNDTVYFGPNIYGGSSPGGQIVDNLDYIAAPEPSTYAMMLGVVGVLALVARARKLLRA